MKPLDFYIPKICGKELNNMKCHYCGCNTAEYYNELIDIHYCHDCSQKAREDWLNLISKIVDYTDKQKEEIL